MSTKKPHQMDALKRKAPPAPPKTIYVKVMMAVPVALFRYLDEHYEDPQLAANELLIQSIILNKTESEVATA